MTVEAVVYTADALENYDDLTAARTAEGTTWVRVTDADQAAFKRVADTFGIHPLAVEDVVNEVRPKTEEFDGYTFVLLKTAELARGDLTFEDEITTESVGVFIGDDWVVTMAAGDDEPVDRVWRAVETGDERLLQRGPDFTAYRVCDVIVDEYFGLLDRVEDDIEAIEEEVTTSTDIDVVSAINDVRRDLLSFRRLAWPAREAMGSLAPPSRA